MNDPRRLRHWREHRPPWWPEDEPWPPQRPPSWQRMRKARGRFFQRMGCVFGVVLLLFFGYLTALFWAAANLLGMVHNQGIGNIVFSVGVVILFLAITAFILIVIRLIRRTAMPLGDLLEAAGRIAEGDYSVRVEERGPGELRSLTRAYNEMAARLAAHQEQRRNLLADVTHELRTPITVIQGNLEGMLDGIYPADRPHLESILEETQVLSRVIEDLRTLSLAESGSLRLQLQHTDLGELVRETVTLFAAQAKEGQVNLRVDLGDETPALEVDPTRIREVLSNLVSNALRYTPPGGEICVRIDRPGPDSLRVAVIDTGRGISAEDLPHIFDRFYKTSDSHGTGLGLPIAKSLVEAHQGEISAESLPGKGTTISFRLPIPS